MLPPEDSEKCERFHTFTGLDVIEGLRGSIIESAFVADGAYGKCNPVADACHCALVFGIQRIASRSLRVETGLGLERLARFQQLDPDRNLQ